MGFASIRPVFRRQGKCAGAAIRYASVLAALIAIGAGLGCSPLGVVETAGTMAAVRATQERGFEQAVIDDRIWTEINGDWLDADAAMFHKLTLQVHEGRVLITGVLPNEKMRIEAVRIAWQVESVKEVINEVRIGEGRDFGDSSQDLWIAKKLEGLLIVDAAVKSQNYSIEAVYGTLYLIGIAQDRAELQRVIDHARDVPYVKQVVSHVRLLTETAAAPAI